MSWHFVGLLQDKIVIHDWKPGMPRGQMSTEGSDVYGGPTDSCSPPRRWGEGGRRQQRQDREPRTPRDGEHGESGGPGWRGSAGGGGGGTNASGDRKSKVCLLEFLLYISTGYFYVMNLVDHMFFELPNSPFR